MPGTGFPSRNNNILGQQDRYPGAPGWAYRACGLLLDIPHIWCILTRLFMRSIIAPVLVNIIGQRVIGLGRYRLSGLPGLCRLSVCPIIFSKIFRNFLIILDGIRQDPIQVLSSQASLLSKKPEWFLACYNLDRMDSLCAPGRD